MATSHSGIYDGSNGKPRATRKRVGTTLLLGAIFFLLHCVAFAVFSSMVRPAQDHLGTDGDQFGELYIRILEEPLPILTIVTESALFLFGRSSGPDPLLALLLIVLSAAIHSVLLSLAVHLILWLICGQLCGRRDN